MAIATMKLITTESFRARELHVAPGGAFVRGHSVPIFRRLKR